MYDIVYSYMEEINKSSPSLDSPPNGDVNKASPHHSSSSHRSRTPLLLSLFLIIFAGLFLAIWYGMTQQQQQTNMHASNPTPALNVTNQTKLIIGTDPTLPPMEYIENGSLVGYDIDFANAIATELGTPVEFKNIGFDDLFSVLEKKQIDMIISAVTITDERKLKYGFSNPYLNAGQVIITKVTTTDITIPANLAGKRVGVQQGTTNEEEALKYTGEKMVVRFKDFEEAAKALEAGSIDAIITDLPNARGIVGKNINAATKIKNFKIAGDPFTIENYGIVFEKGNTSLKTKVDNALSSLQQKGILEDLKQKWFE